METRVDRSRLYTGHCDGVIVVGVMGMSYLPGRASAELAQACSPFLGVQLYIRQTMVRSVRMGARALAPPIVITQPLRETRILLRADGSSKNCLMDGSSRSGRMTAATACTAPHYSSQLWPLSVSQVGHAQSSGQADIALSTGCTDDSRS